MYGIGRDGDPYAQEAARTVAFGSLTGSYANLGSILAYNANMVIISSSLDTDSFLSFDGGTTGILIPKNAGLVPLYLGLSQVLLKKGAQIQAKYSTAPSVGNLSVTCVHS